MYYSRIIVNTKSGSPIPSSDAALIQFDQRKVKRKLFISAYVVIAFLVIFTIVMNFPFISYSKSGCPDDKPYAVSIMTNYFPCNVICSLPSPSSGFTFGSSNLTAGVSATNSSIATAAITFDMNNPCSATPFFVVSITLTGYGFSEINRWDSNAQRSSATNTVPFNSSQNGSANELIPGGITHFVLYPATTTAKTIEKGELYNLEVKIGVSNSTDGFGTTIAAT